MLGRVAGGRLTSILPPAGARGLVACIGDTRKRGRFLIEDGCNPRIRRPRPKKEKSAAKPRHTRWRGCLLRYLLVELATAFHAVTVGAGQDDELTAFFPEPGCEVSGLVKNLSSGIRNTTTKYSGGGVENAYPLWYRRSHTTSHPMRRLRASSANFLRSRPAHLTPVSSESTSAELTSRPHCRKIVVNDYGLAYPSH